MKTIIVVSDTTAIIHFKTLGLDITGMVGILLMAKERGLIERVKPYLDKLLATNFKLGLGLYNQALTMAGESTEVKKA